jgi:hypothetical protein
LGYPAHVPFVSLMKPIFVHDGEGAGEHLDGWVMSTLDACIESLPRASNRALYAHYLNHQPFTDATERAMLELVPICSRKNLLI